MTVIPRLALPLVVGLLAATPAFGQTFAWNLPGNGDWNSNTSWDPNTGFPNGTTHEALFGNVISTTANVNLTAPVIVNRLTFDGVTGTKAYTIAGNTVILGGTAAVLRSAGTVTSTAYQTVNSNILGSGNVVVDGGRLTLGGNASTFAGSVAVNGGILRTRPDAQNDQPLGNAANPVTVAAGGQLFTDATGFNDSPYAISIAGNGPAGLPTGETGAMRFGGFSPSRWVGLISLAGDASIRFSGSATIRGGVAIGGNTLTFRGTVAEVGIVETGAITGTGNVVYDASSTTVTVNSTYTGTTTVQNGTVFITVPNALGATLGTAANRVIANPGGEVYLNGSSFAVGNKLLTLNGGALVGNSNAKSWAGAITQTAPSTVGAEGINGALTVTGGIDNGGHLLTLRVNFDTSTINVNTVGIAGSGGLAVIAPTSTGLVNLNATGTYAGATTATNARLYANATQATGTGTVTVLGTGTRNGTLGGTGSVAGDVAINAGGILAPGGVAAPGTLTVDSPVTMASGTGFRARLTGAAGASRDQLVLTEGAFAFNGVNLTLVTTGLTGTIPVGTQFTLVQATGTGSITTGHTFNGLANGAVAAAGVGGTDLLIFYEYGQGGRIYLTPVPEPGSVLAVLAGAVVAGSGWRRLRQVIRPA